MRDFSFIAHYDWLLLRANRLLLSCFILLTVFIAFAFWTGNQRVNFQRDTLAELRQSESRSHRETKALVAGLEQTGKPFSGNSHRDPTQPNGAANATGNRYFTLDPSPLAVVAVGQSDLRAYYYKFGLNKKQALYHGEEIENPSALYNGHFDLAFVITFLLPLLIIALTYNVVAGERERGTLPLILAGTTPFKTVTLHKFLFRFGLLTTFFSALMVCGLGLSGVYLLGEAQSVAQLLVLSAGYTAFWFGLSFWVNSRGKSSGFNAAVLVGAWLLLLVVVPALVSVAANILYPMPSRVDLIAETREASDEARKNGAQLLAQFLEDHPELSASGTKPLDTKNFAVTSLTTSIEVEKAIRPLEEAFDAQQQRQSMLVAWCRFFSPAIFVQQTLEDVAGTGQRHYHEFERQMQTAHASYRQFFAQKIFKQEKMLAADYDMIPSPAFQPLQNQASFAIWQQIVILLTLAGLFVGIGLRQIRFKGRVWAVQLAD